MANLIRLRCMQCGIEVSTPVPSDIVVRAWIECPECLGKRPDEFFERKVVDELKNIEK